MNFAHLLRKTGHSALNDNATFNKWIERKIDLSQCIAEFRKNNGICEREPIDPEEIQSMAGEPRMAKVERLWAECPAEERKMVREWSLAQTGLVRALRNGDISVTDYLLIRWRAWMILRAIKDRYE